MDLKKHFIEGNTIFIHGEIDDELLNLFGPIRKLINEQINKNQGKIVIDINSNGGNSSIGRSLIGLIEYAKSNNVEVETIVNEAYSMGSLIAIAGTTRKIHGRGSHLVHRGHISGGYSSSDKEFDRNTEYWRKRKGMSKLFYKHYTKLNTKQLNELFENDSGYLFAEECVKYGLADEIINDIPGMKGQSIGTLSN